MNLDDARNIRRKGGALVGGATSLRPQVKEVGKRCARMAWRVFARAHLSPYFGGFSRRESSIWWSSTAGAACQRAERRLCEKSLEGLHSGPAFTSLWRVLSAREVHLMEPHPSLFPDEIELGTGYDTRSTHEPVDLPDVFRHIGIQAF